MRRVMPAALGALICAACVSGQGSSFATRVGGSGGGSDDPAGVTAGDGFAGGVGETADGFNRRRRGGLLAGVVPAGPASRAAAGGQAVSPADPGDYRGRPILASAGNVLLPPNLGAGLGGMIAVDQGGYGLPTVTVTIGGAATSPGQPAELGGATSSVLASLDALTPAEAVTGSAIELAVADAPTVLSSATSPATSTVATLALASPMTSPATAAAPSPVLSPAASPVVAPIAPAAPALSAPKPATQPLTSVGGGAVSGVLAPVARAPAATPATGTPVRTVAATGAGVGQAVAGTVAAVADPATVAAGLGGLAGRHR